MSLLVHSLALVATVLALAYLGLLLHGAYRRQARLAQLHEEERALLRARLERVNIALPQVSSQKTQAWSGWRKFRVDGKVLEAESVCSFYLAPHDGRALPPYAPGQYLTFRLTIPGQAREVTRCYSLSDSPHPDYYRVTIKRIAPPPGKADAPPGLASSHFHDQIQVGDILDVKAPGGNFHLDVEHRGPVVLIGGGVGVTPVLGMMNYLASAPGNREAWFFYGVRNSREHIMKDYLRELASQHENLRLAVCYSDPLPEDRPGEDYQHGERVSVQLLKKVLEVNNFDFYICGPPPMMESLTRDLGEWGVPEERIHFEAFGPASVKKVAQVTHSAPSPEAGAFEIAFTRSNKKIPWSGSGSLLEFAEANGIRIDSGCRAGSCGTCATAIRDGQVNYLRKPDAEIEKGSCLTCISVPKGSLSLDA